MKFAYHPRKRTFKPTSCSCSCSSFTSQLGRGVEFNDILLYQSWRRDHQTSDATIRQHSYATMSWCSYHCTCGATNAGAWQPSGGHARQRVLQIRQQRHLSFACVEPSHSASRISTQSGKITQHSIHQHTNPARTASHDYKAPGRQSCSKGEATTPRLRDCLTACVCA